MLPKANKVDVAGTMEAIEYYIRSCHVVEKAPLAYIIRKTIVVEAYALIYGMQLLMKM